MRDQTNITSLTSAYQRAVTKLQPSYQKMFKIQGQITPGSSRFNPPPTVPSVGVEVRK